MAVARDTSCLSDVEFLAEVRRRIAAERIPFTGSMDLTHRCNLKCLHCYLGDLRAPDPTAHRELSTDQWRRIIGEMADAGCFELLMTGGEPLLRPDFAAIYTDARERGILVAVFTNAMLINDRVADLWKDLPPMLVEASIYGATAETHDRITGVAGSWSRTLAGMRCLLGRGIKAGLKTILMKPNLHEYREMEQLAESMGCSWRLDSAVFPCLPGGDGHARTSCGGRSAVELAPLDLRVDSATAVELECSAPRRVAALRDAYRRLQSSAAAGQLYTCGAGLTGFHVDPYGFLQPCLLTPGYQCSVLDRGFAAAWREIGRVRDVAAPPGYECGRCDKRPICSGCPAIFDLENGAGHIKSKYLCETAQMRYDVIKSEARGGERPNDETGA